MMNDALVIFYHSVDPHAAAEPVPLSTTRSSYWVDSRGSFRHHYGQFAICK